MSEFNPVSTRFRIFIDHRHLWSLLAQAESLNRADKLLRLNNVSAQSRLSIDRLSPKLDLNA